MTHSLIVSVKKLGSTEHPYFLIDFGSVNYLLNAYALVLDKAILGKRIFFFTKGRCQLSANGHLHVVDDDILLKFKLDLGDVSYIDVESKNGWDILDYSDYGDSALVHFKTYPNDKVRSHTFKFRAGYKKVRSRMLPSGGFISLEQRKAMLEFIEKHLDKVGNHLDE